MADKKDKTKETKGSDKKKDAAKTPKVAAKPKASTKAVKKDAKAAEGVPESVAQKTRSRAHPDAEAEAALS